ncbi:MAG: triose-phosphate isomerase [Opitutales bacterium]
MTRKYLIAGNWKMNKTAAEAFTLAGEIAKEVGTDTSVDVLICPTFTALESARRGIASSSLKLGSQNVYVKQSGAYTGEISPEMLKEFFCSYAILGHSERREYFNESDEFINAKVLFCIENNLKPILCVGETLAQREANETIAVIEKQVVDGLKGVSNDDAAKVVIAYEPVWAIGTGKTATPEMAQEVHAEIRAMLAKQFGEVAEKVQILYGGSMNPQNADALLAQKDIDGGLIGGAALKAETFMQLVDSAKKASI